MKHVPPNAELRCAHVDVQECTYQWIYPLVNAQKQQQKWVQKKDWRYPKGWGGGAGTTLQHRKRHGGSHQCRCYLGGIGWVQGLCSIHAGSMCCRLWVVGFNPKILSKNSGVLVHFSCRWLAFISRVRAHSRGSVVWTWYIWIERVHPTATVPLI